MKIFLLGGNRYVGKSLLKLLKKKDNENIVYSLSRNKNIDNIQNHFLGDRQNIDNLEYIFKDIRPDILIDMICYSRNDLQGILHLKDKGFLKSLKHYIVISSFFVYKYFSLNLYKEEKINKELLNSSINDTYTKNKIEMETLLAKSELFQKSTIVRLPFIFSNDDYTKRFQYFCKLAASKPEDFFDNNFSFSMISKNSAVFGIYELIKNNLPKGCVDLANTGCLNQRKMSQLIKKIAINKSIKDSFNIHIPYLVEKNLCISTNKVKVKKALQDEVVLEASKIFKNY
ncbi:hypothetical protein OA100_00830 [Alphaproteobacteria bacterium]|nr:hypothetical protein [Alphaproteobacteria bacterium]